MLPSRCRLAGFVVMVLLSLTLAATATAQKFRTVTDAKKGFKVKMLRWVKGVPNQPLEEQILAKFSGVKKSKRAKDKDKDKSRGGAPDPSLEFWVVHIRKKGPITKAGNQDPGAKAPKDIAEQSRRRLNSGRNLEEFLKPRINPVYLKGLSDVTRKRLLKAPDKTPFLIKQFIHNDLLLMRTYMLDYQGEFFGLVVLGGRAGISTDLGKDIDAIARSLRRIEVKEPRYATTDPYKDTTLPMVTKRRVVRDKLQKGWHAYDTEHFILISDMVSNTYNRRLLQDMLTDLEVMRKEYEKHFPPLQEVTAVSTVRVCNSYEGYQRYSKKPGTGGYWHPVAEELVLFNPSKKVKKRVWMRKVTPVAILYHEAMHQYFHYSNGNVPPASWFNEGYGEYFGGSVVERVGKRIRKIEKNAFRWGVVKKHRKENKWPNLEKMLKATQRQFYNPKEVSQNYAFGWAFCYFLELERKKKPQERNEQWAGIPERYIKKLRAAAAHYRKKMPEDTPKGSILRWADPIQKRAFEKTFKSIDLPELEAAWIEAIKSW
ncbi:MAG: DUF1570 domain-containing protein [Planctomycetota bacterium]